MLSIHNFLLIGLFIAVVKLAFTRIFSHINNITNALEREKQFSADAAHELRTPLASIKTHAQVAIQANNMADKNKSINKVLIGIDRCTHIIEQLSILNSLKPDEPINSPEYLNLNIICSEVIAELVPQALEKNTEISFVGYEKIACIYGNAISIRILLRNIIDNAIRYTQKNGTIVVKTKYENNQVILQVIDNGPGIPENLRTRVLDRYYRQLGTGTSGSGLGLSIVNMIARLHKAKIDLSDGENGCGLTFSVAFRI